MNTREHIPYNSQLFFLFIGILIFISFSSLSSDTSVPKDLEFSFFDDDFDNLTFTLEKKGETILLKSSIDFSTENFPRTFTDFAKPLEPKSKNLSIAEFTVIWEKLKSISSMDFKQYKSLIERGTDCNNSKGCDTCEWNYLHYSTAGKTVESWKRNICKGDNDPPSKFSKLFELIKANLYGSNEVGSNNSNTSKDYKKN